MGADLTSTDINKGYITCSKSNINSMVQHTEENNVLPPQGPTNNDTEEELAGVATTLSHTFSSPNNLSSQQLTRVT